MTVAALRVVEPLSVLAELSRAVAERRGPGMALDEVVRALVERMGARWAVLVVRGPAGLRVEAAQGIAARSIRLRASAGVLGRVATSGKPIIVPMFSREAMAMEELEMTRRPGDPEQAVLSVPLLSGGLPGGALGAGFAVEPALDYAATVKTLEVAASLLARMLEPEPEPSGESRQSSAELGDASDSGYGDMVGSSAAARQVYEQVAQVARTNATVLIRGESGTGKELVAQAIHTGSLRATRPFVKVNCAALAESVVESELFGHEKGAFTGAHAQRKGRFELADGGTLFLDEVGELTPSVQAKLLRVLQSREFERLGGAETLRSNVRIVAATNKDLERATAQGTFREDLYYRLNVFSIQVPPLRERRSDIPSLARHFVAKFASAHDRRISGLTTVALDRLTRFSWPGNVRQLENVLERAVLVCSAPLLDEEHLPPVFREDASPEQLPLAEAVARFEKQLLENALEATNGNRARAARLLQTTERILGYKVTKLGIDCDRFRGR